MENAQKEEFKHFSMDLEWLLCAKPIWREIARGVLFKEGDIVKSGEKAEEKAQRREIEIGIGSFESIGIA